MKARKPPLVEVTWTDAQDIHESGVKHEDALKYGLIERTHVGYLVSEDAEIVRLAAGLDADGYDNLTILPRGWVSKIRYVRKPRRNRHAKNGNETSTPAPVAGVESEATTKDKA